MKVIFGTTHSDSKKTGAVHRPKSKQPSRPARSGLRIGVDLQYDDLGESDLISSTRDVYYFGNVLMKSCGGIANVDEVQEASRYIGVIVAMQSGNEFLVANPTCRSSDANSFIVFFCPLEPFGTVGIFAAMNFALKLLGLAFGGDAARLRFTIASRMRRPRNTDMWVSGLIRERTKSRLMAAHERGSVGGRPRGIDAR
jgi:hypothetical protein